MNFKKLKRVLSVALSLCMVLSTNMTGFAADASVAADNDVQVHADEAADTEEHVHNWELVNHTRQPNCTKKGMDRYMCEEDGEVEYRYVDALGHDWERDGYVEVTGDPEEDENVNTIIVSEASCTTSGTKKHICSVCGVESEEIEYEAGTHEWGTEPVKHEATCTEAAYTVIECTICHEEKEDTKVESTTELATGHSYDKNEEDIVVAYTDNDCTKAGTITKTCTNENCPNEEPVVENIAAGTNEHSWGEKVNKPATCTKQAASYMPCENEGCQKRSEEKIDETSEPTGHKFDNGVVTTPAKCTTDGVKTYTCQNENCDEGADEDGHGKTYTEAVEATGHNHTSAVTTPATCTVAGVKTYTCQNEGCDEGTDEDGHGKTYTEAINALGHDYAKTVVTAATCTAGGEESYTCKRVNCDEGVDEDGHGKTYTADVEALGHNWVNHAEVPPTCGTKGTTAGKTCTRCDAKEGMEEIPMNGNAHDYTGVTPVTYKPATCTTNGLAKYTCKVCQKATQFGIIPASHKYQKAADINTVSNMTVEEYTKAVQAYLTDNAGAGVLTDYVDVTTQPGCESTGEAEFTCWNCSDETDDHSITVTVAATGHNYVNDANATYDTNDDGVAMTCKPGKLYARCSNTGCPKPTKVVDSNVAPSGTHNYVDQSSEATCESPGMKGKKCSVCGDSDPENPYGTDPEKPRLGHSYEQHNEDGTVVEGADGETVFVEGKVDEDENGDPVLVDEDGNIIATNVTEATCKAPGSATYTCTECNAGDENNSVERILAQLEHDEEGLLHVISAATCQRNAVIAYTCSQCKEDQTSGDAVELLGQEAAEIGEYVQLDHTWGEPKILRAPSCETGRNGVAQYTCITCDEDVEAAATDIQTLPYTHSYQKIVGENKVTLTEEEYTTKLTAANKTVADYIQHTTLPECEEEGEDTYICTDCTADATGHTTTVTVEATGHDFDGDPVESEWPNGICKPGVGTFECQNGCGETDEKAIPKADDHKWIEAQETATCEYPAATGDAKCAYCGDDRDPDDPYTVTAPRLGHSYEAKDEDGNVIEGTNGKRVIAENAAFVEVKADCETDGSKTYTCDDCTSEDDGNTYVEEISALGHDEEAGDVIEATCQKNAILVTMCSRCDKVMSEDDAEEILGHDTAAAMGYLIKDHTMDDITVIAAPSCTKNGIARYTCSTCDSEVAEVVTELKVVPAMHSYQELGENGTIVTMSKEDYTEKLTEDGKTVADYIKTKVAAGCESEGTDTYVCTICSADTTNHETDVTVEATGHDYDMANGVEDYPDGECKAGTITYTCKNGCSEDLEDHIMEEAIPAKIPHEYEDKTTTATCRTPEMSGSFCKTCGQTKPGTQVTITGSMNGHDYEVINPTEDGRGEVSYEDEAKTQKTIKASATGQVTKEPACEETGTKVYTCETCKDKPEEGAVYTETLLATGHDFEYEYVEATCSSNGKLKVTCKNDETEEFDDEDLGDVDPLDPNAHSYKEDKKKSLAPTCDTAGYRYMVCEYDATHINRVTISARHDWEEVWLDEESNPVDDPLDAIVGYSHCKGKCDQYKIIFIEDGYVYCEKEDKVYEITPDSILAKVDPTCTTTGLTAGQKCPHCGTIIVAQNVIPSLGHDMEWKDITDPSKAVCEDRTLQQVCKNDNTHKGGTKTVASTTPHEYEEKGIDPVNCGDAYKVVKECENCHQADPDYTIQEFPEIAVKAHNFVDGICTNCNKPRYATNIKMEIVEEGVIRITAEVPVNDPSMKVTSRGLIFTNKKAYQNVEPSLDIDMVVEQTATLIEMKTDATGISYTINIPANMRDRKIWTRAFIWFENDEEATSQIIGMSYNDLVAQSQTP